MEHAKHNEKKKHQHGKPVKNFAKHERENAHKQPLDVQVAALRRTADALESGEIEMIDSKMPPVGAASDSSARKSSKVNMEFAYNGEPEHKD